MDTDLTPFGYLDTLALDGGWEAVHPLVDGAGVYQVADEHYVIIACIEHDGHEGHAYLLQLFPEDWECFHQAVSGEYGYEAFHYGPPE